NLLSKYHRLMGNDVVIIAPTLKLERNGSTIDLVNSSFSLINNSIGLYRLCYKYKLPRFINDKIRVYEGLFNLLKKLQPEFIFVHGVQFLDVLSIVKYYKYNPNITIVADNHADDFNSANNFISTNILHKI